MTYDVVLVPGPAPADDDWEPNLEAADATPVGPLVLAAWPRIVERVRAVLPRAVEQTAGDVRRIGDPDTGLHITIGPDEAALAVPYWHRGEEAVAIGRQIAAVVAVLEEATGLLAFDPQTGLGFVPDERAIADGFDRIGGMADELGIEVGPLRRRRWWRWS